MLAYDAEAVDRAGLRVGYPAVRNPRVAHSPPAVLVECGFLSNDREGHLLPSPHYRARVAEAIAAGIADYFH
jgi:N-acetylmuramoyl-L-alanine amidase